MLLGRIKVALRCSNLEVHFTVTSFRHFIVVSFLFLSMSATCPCAVSTIVRFRDSNLPLELADSNIPNVYREIMEGTELSITIDSNVAQEWSGLLLIEDDFQNYGVLYGRGYDGFYYYLDSVLEDAGEFATAADFKVNPWDGKDVNGVQLWTDFEPEPTIGEWFIVDYNATEIGDCNVAFYWNDFYGSGNHGLLYNLEFKQVRSCDFDGSYQVDFNDFALFASYWDCNCTEPDWCEGTDLDDNNSVDFNDLYLFSKHWLDITR